MYEQQFIIISVFFHQHTVDRKCFRLLKYRLKTISPSAAIRLSLVLSRGFFYFFLLIIILIHSLDPPRSDEQVVIRTRPTSRVTTLGSMLAFTWTQFTSELANAERLNKREEIEESDQ